jgi:glycosyltransferase involved in cell wall biosynthesis
MSEPVLVANAEPHARRRTAPGAAPPPAPTGAGAGLRALYIWQAEYPWDVRVEKICRSLQEYGLEVHVSARNRAWEPPVETLPEAVAHRLAPWRWLGRRLDGALQFPAFFSPRWVRHVSATIRRIRPSVIIVRDVPLAPTVIWVARRYGVPVVLDMAENYPALMEDIWTAGRQRPWDLVVRHPRLVAAVESYAVQRVDHVVVVVEENADRLAALGLPRERMTIVSNTPPRARALAPRRTSARASDAPLEIVFLGTLEIPRGLNEAIDAVKHLRDEGVRARLTVAGRGRDAELFARRARDIGLTEKEVVFTGYIPRHEDALELVASADVGVVPFHVTGQWQASIPNKLFDYMAAGLAVVTSDTAPCARIVRETGAGEVFRAGDARDLTRALRRLTDPESRHAAGEAGRRAVLARYNWEHDAGILCRTVEAVAKRAGAPAGWGP